MDWLANIPLIGSPAVTVLAFIVLIGVVIAFHEFGHYIVARWVGIHAEVFSLGFGPKIWSRVDKRGTRWQLAAIPLGGYVRFLGDKDAASTAAAENLAQMNAYDRRRSFPAAAVWRRFLTVLAGPMFNFVLSLIIFTGLTLWIGLPADRPVIGKVAPLPYENQLQQGDIVLSVNGQSVQSYEDLFRLMAEIGASTDYSDMKLVVERDGVPVEITAPFPATPYITSVFPFSPAYDAGIEIGDVIVAVNGREIHSFSQLKAVITGAENQQVQVRIWRAGAVMELTMTPELTDLPDGKGGFRKDVLIGVSLGAYFEPERNTTPSVPAALQAGAAQLWDVLRGSITSIKYMIAGDISVKNLQGPIGIARMSGMVAKIGWPEFLGLIGAVSAAIGLFNLFPIPVLDGGHLATYVYEAIMRRPPNRVVMQVLMTMGMVLLLSMMLLASYNDIMRL